MRIKFKTFWDLTTPDFCYLAPRGWWGQKEEVQVRKVCAFTGVILREGMERSTGEGLFTCGKGISVALGSLPARGPQICACGEDAAPPTNLSTPALRVTVPQS